MTEGIRARRSAIATPLFSVLLSDMLTVLAEMVGYITLPWWIVHQAGARDLAIYSACVAMATIVAMAALSPLGDRYAKRTQMVWGIVALMAMAFIFAVFASLHIYRLLPIICIAFVIVGAKAFVDPASATILAELLPSNRLAEALRLRRSIRAVGRALGPAFAGIALALGGIASAFWVNGILFGLAAFAASRLHQLPPQHNRPRGLVGWWHDVQAGMRAKWAVPLERGWTLVNFIVWIFQGPAVGMLIPLKVQSLGMNSVWLCACEVASSIGLLVGSFRGSDALVRRFGRFNVRVGAAMAEGLALAASGLTHTPALLVMTLACAGFANASMSLVGATHRTLAIPSHFRVRLLAASIMSTQIAGTLGPMLAGVVLTHWSVGLVYTCFGLATCVCAFGFILIPRSREFLALDHDQVKNWLGREYPDAFQTNGEDGFKLQG